MEPLSGKLGDPMEKSKQELILRFIREVARELLNTASDQLGTHIKERLSRMQFERFLEEYEKKSVETSVVHEGNKPVETKDRWR
jgi:hypothetical protein